MQVQTLVPRQRIPPQLSGALSVLQYPDVSIVEQSTPQEVGGPGVGVGPGVGNGLLTPSALERAHTMR
jgi:hypothetical protein